MFSKELFKTVQEFIDVCIGQGGAFHGDMSTLQKNDKELCLLISHELSMTGAPLALLNMAKVLEESGKCPIIVSPFDGPLRQEFQKDSFLLIAPIFSEPELIYKAHKLFSFIVANTAVVAPVLSLLNGTNTPVLWWIHEAHMTYNFYSDLRFMPSFLNNNIKVYAVGEWAREGVMKVRPKYNVKELLYYIDDITKQEQSSVDCVIKNKEGKRVFAVVGTIDHRKGQDIFFNAIDNLPKPILEKSLFVLVGRINDESYTTVLEEALKKYPNNIQHIEHLDREHMGMFYKEIDCLIVSSRDEPMAMTITEACQFEKIIISSDHSGYAPILQSSNAGFVFANERADELAKYIVRVCDGVDDELNTMRSNSRKVYETYFTKQVFMKKINDEVLPYLLKDNTSSDEVNDELLEDLLNSRFEIFGLNRKLNELQIDNSNKSGHIDLLIESERKLKGYESGFERQKKEIEQQKKEIDKKNDIINNQQEQISQLLEIERYYHQIIASKGWRLVSFPGKVFEKMYPQGTPRRERISKEYRYVTAINPTNIKFVADAFKRGGVAQVKAEMHAFGRRVDNERAQDAIQAPKTIKENEITDVAQCKKIPFKKWDNPTVSIVIPVYNQFTYTYNCLRTIRKNSGKVKYEIIIADDVSTDLTTRLSEVAENITIVRNKENQRFLLNCNNAAKHAKGKYILFLNNDTQVQENWLEPLVTLIESKDDIGMVGSKLIYPDGTLQEAGGIIWGDAPGHAWNYGNGQNPAEPEFNYVKEVDYISGASLMIKTSLWKEIGGFDEYFAPAYCEDSDLAFEVRKRGYKVLYQPLSVVVHFEGKSNGTDTSSGVKKYQVENSEKLMKKWAKEFETEQSHSETELFKARERSQRKKTILVIDHYVPQFDKDAGSKTTWQYLKMFVKQGYNVKFMGDNFYQDEPYTTKLQQLGIEVLYGPWYANNYKQWIIDHKNDIDFVYLNRPHITEKYIDFLKNETNIKCIYYGHDLHFLRIHREYELNGNEELLKESEEWKNKEFAIMKKADINYYPSYVEVDEIHKLEPDIKAKAITAYVFEEFRNDIDVDFSKKNGILFVGGFGHPPNEDAVLWFAKEVYPSIKKEQDIPFYIVGSNVTENVEKLQGDGIILKGFVTEEELQELYNTCRIVVVPLRYGAGVKGKVVEALYYGTPMVTTTVGIEGIRDAEKFMEVADEAPEFAKKVLALYNAPERLKKTVEDYQNYVKENNSVDAVWKIVEEDFQ